MTTTKIVQILMLTFIGVFLMVDFTFGDDNEDIFRVGDQICPGRRTKCLDNQTCCSIGGGSYGCCPYAGATCCRDQRSCCPAGFNCDIQSGRCTRSRKMAIARNQIPWIRLQRSEFVNTTIVNSVDDYDSESSELTVNGKKLCPDGKQSCPESYTCCAQLSGSYGCCPLTGGICCPDGVHCCPMGTECNTKLGSCD